MPQMMPLMWIPLFITFSLILNLSFTKIYFSSQKPSILSNGKVNFKNIQKTSWTW